MHYSASETELNLIRKGLRSGPFAYFGLSGHWRPVRSGFSCYSFGQCQLLPSRACIPCHRYNAPNFQKTITENDLVSIIVHALKLKKCTTMTENGRNGDQQPCVLVISASCCDAEPLSQLRSLSLGVDVVLPSSAVLPWEHLPWHVSPLAIVS